MIKLIEKLLNKMRGNTVGYDFNITDWDILTLGKKSRSIEPYTKAEKHAIAFLEEVGEVLEQWHQTKKCERPTGQILNENRKLH